VSGPENAPTPPKPPPGLGPRGLAFWTVTASEFELTEGELAILREACRTLDTLDALAEVIATGGPMAKGSAGQPVLHPAVAEARAQRLVLHRLLSALNLPDPEGTPQVTSARSASSRQKARQRWQGVATDAAKRRGA
jgi:hypothetical protein